jgi:prepilin peptidase CpaA
MMPPLLPWVGPVLVALLVVAAVTDLKYGRIYNAVSYSGIAVGLIGHTLMEGAGWPEGQLGLLGSLAGLAVGFLPLFVAWKAGGIGGGDAKISGAIGALMGPKFALLTLFYGLIAAAVMAFAVMIRRRIVWETLKRIGRFVYLALTPAKPSAPVTPDSPKVAFGLALCFGAAAAVVDELLSLSRSLGF